MHKAILALGSAVILAQIAQAEDWRPVEIGTSPGAVKFQQPVIAHID